MIDLTKKYTLRINLDYVVYALAVLALMLFMVAKATAQDEPLPAPTHPAFGDIQEPHLSMSVRVVDPQKAAADAEFILSTKYGLTLEEAHEKILTNGEIDLARCVEYILHDALNTIPPTLTSSLDVTVVTIALRHPEPLPEPTPEPLLEPAP